MAKSNKNINIRVSNNLEWIFPYVRAVYRKMPNIFTKIKSIRGYKVAIKKDIQNWGSINSNGKHYSICILTHTNENGKYKKLYMNSILDTLAHELAHTVYWDHDGRHFALQGKIIYIFGMVMQDLKITNYNTIRTGVYHE